MNCVSQVFPKDIVVGFDNPAHALNYADTRKVDICFADIEMDSMTGLTLTKELREKNNNICMNLIAENQDYAVEAWMLHVNDYIIKPVTKDAVRHTIYDMN